MGRLEPRQETKSQAERLIAESLIKQFLLEVASIGWYVFPRGARPLQGACNKGLQGPARDAAGGSSGADMIGHRGTTGGPLPKQPVECANNSETRGCSPGPQETTTTLALFERTSARLRLAACNPVVFTPRIPDPDDASWHWAALAAPSLDSAALQGLWRVRGSRWGVLARPGTGAVWPRARRETVDWSPVGSGPARTTLEWQRDGAM
ncbi:hypothetical protein BKA56DRAFT_718036 [Ilyonectria sp. MPI-CAGE-AT-0026]|nr:hypothetical protein BKA56DRAFT_718036 [Ilyonectria sp. MPI-CAGE-AT-0026]